MPDLQSIAINDALGCPKLRVLPLRPGDGGGDCRARLWAVFPATAAGEHRAEGQHFFDVGIGKHFDVVQPHLREAL